MHFSRSDFLNIILYVQHIVNHRVKMEAHAWPEISAPAHMVLWDQDAIQVSKREKEKNTLHFSCYSGPGEQIMV